MRYNQTVKYTCPNCGDVRYSKWRTGRPQGGMNRCAGCSIRITKSKKDWTVTHGESRSKLYQVWQAMKQRCENLNNESYHRYGGRGIKVCPLWFDYVKFKNWAFHNGYRVGLTIDRRNNDRGYNPINCRWVTSQVNAMNRSTTVNKDGGTRTAVSQTGS